MVADSGSDVVLRLTDMDRSGTVEPAAGESRVFYDDASPGPDLSVPSHMALGVDGAVYLLDGGTVDAVLRLEDLNGDADADDPGEFRSFYDASGGGPALATPNTLVHTLAGNSFYISDDGSRGKRILRIADLDGDGSAEGEGEQQVVYDAAALSLPVLEDVEAIAMFRGGLLAADSTLQSVFYLQDIDGDGNFTGLGEQTLFLDTNGAVPLSDIDAMVVVNDVVYVADEDSGNILAVQDVDGDDAIGPQEWRVYLDSTTAPRVSDINDFIAAPAGGLMVLDGVADTVWYVFDDDNSGSIDEGEAVLWLVDDGETLATPTALVFVPSEPTPLAEPFVRGDANGDGELDVGDVTAGLGHLFLGERIDGCRDRLDADDSGGLNISDGVFSLNHLFLGGPQPPPPFPCPGLDPTADDFGC